MVSQMIRPTRILEIGTFSGYGTICLAKGLLKGGIIDTIEINDELEQLITENIAISGYQNQINLHIGDARNLLPALDYEYDLVFVDAEKDEYCDYFDLIIDKIKPGAYLLVDNVLWSGKVVSEDIQNKDHFTKGILKFNRKIQNDHRVENFILPAFDGIMVIRKI